MKPLRKAIFPVAGLGTRFLPATKSIPKEMLTIVDKPLIQYAVDEAIEAGIEVLIFVTSRSKRALEDYFDSNPELEAELTAKNKTEALAAIQNIIPKHIQCIFVRQEQPLGLGHAVLCAAELIQDEPFAVLLPDDLIANEGQGSLAQMKTIHEQHQSAVLAIEPVPMSEVHKYGVIKAESVNANTHKILDMVEKPKADVAPSNLSVVGRYILTPDVMEALKTQTPGAGGEIQLTDAIARCVPSGKFIGFEFVGKRFDCGNKKGFLEANMQLGKMASLL